MKAVTVKKIKDELTHKTTSELMEICLQLSKFKKENKELLTYLLFESHNEEEYVESIKEEINELFEKVNTKSYFYIRKSVRKILTTTKKFIRYSKKKETEVALLLFFCQQILELDPPIKNNVTLWNLYNRQMDLVRKSMKSLHEDLQYDYREDMQRLK